jgi:hypothetical protein
MAKFTVLFVSLAVGLITTATTNAQFGPITFSSDADYNNNNPPTSGLFRDLGPLDVQQDINRGLDLGGTGHTALNFTTHGNGTSAGTNSVTLYDTDPTTPAPNNIFSGSFTLSGDILFKEFANSKAGGFVFFYNEGNLGTNGLAVTLWDAGGTDQDKVQIEGFHGGSSPMTDAIKTNSLPGTIGESQWYRLTLDIHVNGGTFDLTAKVFGHATTTDPGSALGAQIGSTLLYTNTFAALNLSSSGEIGLTMRAINMDAPNTNMVSITNFSEVPEPTTFSMLGLVLGLGGLLTAIASRRKRT